MPTEKPFPLVVGKDPRQTRLERLQALYLRENAVLTTVTGEAEAATAQAREVVVAAEDLVEAADRLVRLSEKRQDELTAEIDALRGELAARQLDRQDLLEVELPALRATRRDRATVLGEARAALGLAGRPWRRRRINATNRVTSLTKRLARLMASLGPT